MNTEEYGYERYIPQMDNRHRPLLFRHPSIIYHLNNTMKEKKKNGKVIKPAEIKLRAFNICPHLGKELI